jgi:hypothetical protein
MHSKKPPWVGRFFAVMGALAERLRALKSPPFVTRNPGIKTVSVSVYNGMA